MTGRRQIILSVILKGVKDPLGLRRSREQGCTAFFAEPGWLHLSRSVSYWVYIITHRPYGTVYIGMTNDVRRRIWQHRSGAIDGFSKRYGLKRLVYFERLRDITAAIEREKQIKGWLRRKKIDLIEQANPLWRDLSEGWYAGDTRGGDSPNPSSRRN